MRRSSPLTLSLLALVTLHVPLCPVEAATERNNWAVLVDTSRYWYNYRHVANVLTFYHTIKRLGIPDSQIILMLAEDMACNPRNARPGTVFNEQRHRNNLYGEDVEVDYRGDEVSVENFIRLLTGRHPPNTPRNKRLLTDSMSNVFIFITGHSGEEFIKFQDWEEITSNDIADAFGQMHRQKRYQNIFWVSDTCQAATLQNQFYSPNIIAIGSSGKNENSYSHHVDQELGIAVIDRFTFYAFDWLRALTPSSTLTIQNFLDFFDPKNLHATPELRGDLYHSPPNRTHITDFFAASGRMRFQDAAMPLSASTAGSEGAEPGSCLASPAEGSGSEDGSCAVFRASSLSIGSGFARRTGAAGADAESGLDRLLSLLSGLPGFQPKAGAAQLAQATALTDMKAEGISASRLRWQGAFGVPGGATYVWLIGFLGVLGVSLVLL